MAATPATTQKEKTKIAVITSTRADYGLLRPVISAMEASKTLQPLVVATGTHLEPEYGNTIAELEADGIHPAAYLRTMPAALGEPDELAVSRVMAKTLKEFTEWFAEARPAAVLLLGDRYEIFAVASASATLRIPVCHISGGDVTLGAADEFYRHCISKMATLHFPSNAQSAARLVRMGCAPETVFCVGGLGDENIRKLPKMSREELCQSTGLPLQQPFALVTFHPETAGSNADDPAAQCTALTAAMEKTPGVFWLITGSNADAGGAVCNSAMQAFATAHPERAAFVASLGLVRYLSAMACAALVLGNSSSGVVETPSFGVPTINIGNRQDGRAICANVLCCPATEAAIAVALQTALSPDFAVTAKSAQSPYNGGDTAQRIVKALEARVPRPGFGEPKPFYDGPIPAFSVAGPDDLK